MVLTHYGTHSFRQKNGIVPGRAALTVWFGVAQKTAAVVATRRRRAATIVMPRSDPFATPVSVKLTLLSSKLTFLSSNHVHSLSAVYSIPS